ncbi:DUF1192 domain-containing protein [Sphingomonas sp. KC8]|uniref:DUF1192 domain-containing protein n=1 Tax=Sphingomonas sp. KC8 TaxID=1030157 RepID=UPI0002488EDA|nr:DUF1192 domain-containing protein [Sphingomonas sp. KC8]ARS25868.1 hypothetical protein KC8_00975 [Sphingomonas sp. KC8]
MDADDNLPKRRDDLLTLIRLQDLDPFSVDELQARISALEAEIARTRCKIEAAVNHRATAEGLFKR